MKKKNKSMLYPRKKKFLGQHFLRAQWVVDNMIDRVTITDSTPVMEIGCGDGFLTRSILVQTSCKKLVCYEIDDEWATVVENTISDKRLTIIRQSILETDWSKLQQDAPWVLLANLPYQITFPIMFMLQKHKAYFSEGVIMVQEEVAQKIVAKQGKNYSPTSLFLQYHFEFELLNTIAPASFAPPPKVHSRLLYFKPKMKEEINEEFWIFLKYAFRFPGRTLDNNLKSTPYENEKLPKNTRSKRARQMSLSEFFELWNIVKPSS